MSIDPITCEYLIKIGSLRLIFLEDPSKCMRLYPIIIIATKSVHGEKELGYSETALFSRCDVENLPIHLL